MFFIAILLLVIIGLLAWVNHQIWENFTKPRLSHQTLEMEKIYKQWHRLIAKEDIADPAKPTAISDKI